MRINPELQEVITPVVVTIESANDKIELGSAAREALWIEQVQALRAALDEVCTMADEPLDELKRAQLEDLRRYLRWADTAATAVWWLIPADVYTDEAA